MSINVYLPLWKLRVNVVIVNIKNDTKKLVVLAIFQKKLENTLIWDLNLKMILFTKFLKKYTFVYAKLLNYPI